jgi:hypothetical protein
LADVLAWARARVVRVSLRNVNLVVEDSEVVSGQHASLQMPSARREDLRKTQDCSARTKVKRP